MNGTQLYNHPCSVLFTEQTYQRNHCRCRGLFTEHTYLINHCLCPLWFTEQTCPTIKAKQYNKLNTCLLSQTWKQFKITLVDDITNHNHCMTSQQLVAWGLDWVWWLTVSVYACLVFVGRWVIESECVWVSVWVDVWVCDQVSYFMNDWTSESMSEWQNDLLSEWPS